VRNARYLISLDGAAKEVRALEGQGGDREPLVRLPESIGGKEAALLSALLQPLADAEAEGGKKNVILEHTVVERPAAESEKPASGRETAQPPAGTGPDEVSLKGPADASRRYAEALRRLKPGIPVLCLYPQVEEGGRLPLILFAHGFEQSKEKIIRHGLRLASAGFFTLMPDAPLHGERYIPSEFRERFTADPHSPRTWMNRLYLVRAYLGECRFLLDLYRRDARINPARTGMAGMSMGGAVTLLACAADPALSAGVAFVPALDYENLEDPGLVKGVSGDVRARFREFDPLYAITEAPRASLFIQVGAKDTVTGTAGARKLDARLSRFYGPDPSRYRFKEYSDMGHAVSPAMMRDAAAWFAGHL
jgi:dienelactone hydrolase